MNDWNGIVSLLIACLELIILINLLIFAEKNRLYVIIILIVSLLFGYQAIEFFICSLGLSSSFMAYLAFVDITFLPPLNLLFVLKLFKKSNKLISLIFIPAIFFVLYYSVIISEFEVVKCTVLYASYNYPLGDLYGFFYYSPLLIAFILIIKNMLANRESNFPISISYLFYGHLSLVLPVGIAFIFLFFGDHGFISSIESLLCKFAFLYCLSLFYFALSNKQKTA